jgi:hypothetical protein
MVGLTKSNIVIGLGEIGQAIQSIFECYGIDKDTKYEAKHYDVMHVCIPFVDGSFFEIIENYKKQFTPDIVIIHSTVPVGTNKKLGSVASPCRGVHPHLKESILTFVKYFGGKQASEAAEIFIDKGIKVEITDDSDTIEAMKLWCTTQYGLNIILEKVIHRYCLEKGLDFNIIYTDCNKTYNEGYDKLGFPQYKKYVLQHREEPLKGHCILENCSLLKESGFDNKIIDLILSAGKHIDTIKEDKPYLNKVWFYCEHFGKKRTFKDIGNEFGVTGENISQIAHRKGWLTKSSNWTEEENNKLIELSKDYTFKDLARFFDRSYDAIRIQAIKLGLKSIYKPEEETKKDEIRKKISATLQGVSLDEWVDFKEKENSLIRKSVVYKEWRYEVLNRDNYTCVKCGKRGNVEADHIKPFSLYPELRFELDNGQTLCKECHKEKTKEDWKIISQYRNDTL